MSILLTDDQINQLNTELKRIVLNNQNFNVLSFCNDDQNGRISERTCLGDDSGYYPLVENFDFDETLNWLKRLETESVTDTFTMAKIEVFGLIYLIVVMINNNKISTIGITKVQLLSVQLGW